MLEKFEVYEYAKQILELNFYKDMDMCHTLAYKGTIESMQQLALALTADEMAALNELSVAVSRLGKI